MCSMCTALIGIAAHILAVDAKGARLFTCRRVHVGKAGWVGHWLAWFSQAGPAHPGREVLGVLAGVWLCFALSD